MNSLVESRAPAIADPVIVVDRSHVDTLAHSAIANGNRLFCSAAVDAVDLAWHWQHITNQSMRYELVFASADLDDNSRLRIALTGDIIGLSTPIQPWAYYKGAMRVAAWTVAYEPFIDLLCAVSGLDWTLKSVEQLPTAPLRAENESALGFTITRNNEEFEVARGIAYWPDALFEQLATRARPGNDNPLWSGFTARVRCIIDSVTIDASELPALERNSIVILDNQTLLSTKPILRLVLGEYHWHAEIDDTCLRVLSRSDQRVVASFRSFEDYNMESDSENEELEDFDSDPVDISSVPIELRFEVGELSLSFESLKSIRPGFVFELGHPLDQQAITVFANDKPVAAGELVFVGNNIGVRVTAGRPVVPVPVSPG